MIATLQIPKYLLPSETRAFEGLSNAERAVAASLREDGFAVIPFPDDDFDRVADDIRTALEPEFALDTWLDDPANRTRSLRRQDHAHPGVKRLAGNAGILKLLSNVFGKPAFAFQTLNFPVGTQQAIHSDDLHFSSLPAGFMAGVWVALEDIAADAGPLTYYPGSHRLPPVHNHDLGLGSYDFWEEGRWPTQALYEAHWQDLAEQAGLEAKTFLPRKGDTLIWSHALLHGGAPRIRQHATRWSQVSHYFFDDCTYYTPMLSDIPRGDLRVREDVRDIVTGTPKPCRVGRAKLSETGMGLFDEEAYLAANPDVAQAVREKGASAWEHFRLHGAKERRRLR